MFYMPFMMMYQGKVGIIISPKVIMEKGYPKKDASPSSVTSLTTFVLGFVTLSLCDNLGIVSKKSWTYLN